MADECTDVTTIEELFIFCRWTEDGVPVEHFIEIVPMKRADAESIHSALVECLREKSMPLNKIIGMGFDGAATFFWQQDRSADEIKGAVTSCYICTLPLSSASTGLCASCQCYCRHQACVCHTYYVEIFPFLT